MKIVTIAPLVGTVELNPTDCIALAVACARVSAEDGSGLDTLDTTGAAFLAAALAAFAPDTHQERTIAHLWRMWPRSPSPGGPTARRMAACRCHRSTPTDPTMCDTRSNLAVARCYDAGASSLTRE